MFSSFCTGVFPATPDGVAVRVANSMENPAFDLNSPAAVALLTSGTATESGVNVRHETALSCAAVWQAVSMISGDVAGLSLNCYKRTAADDREIDDSHPAQPIVSVEWNDETSANEGWRRAMTHALLWGNAYAWIERDAETGEPLNVYNLLPDRTRPERMKDGTLFYLTEVDGKLEPLRKEEVLHVKGLSINAEAGVDLILKAREAVALSLAAEGFSSRFYSQGCAAGGILEIPAPFTEAAANHLEEGFRKRTEGKANWFKTAILRDGAKFHQQTIDAQKSQTNELRESQVRDVARFFNLPPSKLGVAGSVSYGSAEHAQLDYLSSCLTHWLRAIASECGMKFLTREQRRRTHYFEHNTSNWIEVDTKTIWEVVSKGVASGLINPDEGRRKLNLPKRPDGKGHLFGNPWTTPGGESQAADEPKPDEGKEPEKKEPEALTKTPAPSPAIAIARNALTRDVNRLARKIGNHARTQAKNAQKFADWLDGKALDQRHLVADMLGGAVEDAAMVAGKQPADLMTVIEGRFFSTLIAKLSPLLSPPHKAPELMANVERECAGFENEIAPQIAALVFGE